MIRNRAELASARRVVIKIGSSLLADAEHGIRLDVIDRLVDELQQLMVDGRDIVIVTSGSVALGRVRLDWLGRELTVHEKQAAAAVGQPQLMSAYGKAFGRHGRCVAQMLLTKDDLRNRRRYLNASNTSETLFSVGVVPIVNENDTVVVSEIKFGDNDSLGALVSLVVEADLLVMLTDVDGLYDRNPARHADASRISEISHLEEKHVKMAGDAGSSFGTGGMASKLIAAQIATRAGVTAAIVSGKNPGALTRLLTGEDEGTLFLCGEDRQTRRKHWISELLRSAGEIHIDRGANRAVLEQGCSLLPVGVVAVHGVFDKGDCVEIIGPDGKIGRGLSNYTAEEIHKIMGKTSDEIEEVLGYMDFTSLIHRDNLVLSDAHQPSAEHTGE
ncbi:glutamate 5-kinase [Mariprofundus ferrooxydans]|uniref:Glutamate 5-kinase n=1 Tax=Mariprofundus ferrooxydans PV-1 TaxID=314345 RepID=Q0F1E1_9PROT|nr:glutamate 5-kinase [Mariprofundus ferrooxydans]EAU55250.1 gamma-glutamyl kinase [Mariprofundus ferrooxydans PV-1]KON47225.1 gamma-glutamyl kinase [Mariprofundus ferrooxydans]